MSVRALVLLLAGALAWAPGARADEVGGEGFAVPQGPPFETVRERIFVQLRALEDPIAPGAVARSDLPGTRSVVVISGAEDAPPADVTVDVAARWGETADGLFELGLKNLERKYPPDVRESPEIVPGVTITLFYGEHPFAAAYALSVEHYPKCNGRKGALLAVPNRHAMLCYAINSKLAHDGFFAIAAMSFDIHQTGERPISPNVYWVDDDELETLPITVVNGKPKPATTPEFDRMMKDLPRPNSRRPAPRHRPW